MFLVNK